MLPTTRKKFNAYTDQIASLNNINNVAEKFTVEPTIKTN